MGFVQQINVIINQCESINVDNCYVYIYDNYDKTMICLTQTYSSDDSKTYTTYRKYHYYSCNCNIIKIILTKTRIKNPNDTSNFIDYFDDINLQYDYDIPMSIINFIITQEYDDWKNKENPYLCLCEPNLK